MLNGHIHPKDKFIPELALELCKYAISCYQNYNIQTANATALHIEESDYQILSIAGSDDIIDWIQNAETVKVSRTGMGRIHNGFADYWAQLKPYVLERLNKNKPIYFGSHSLGGSVSKIIALYLKQRGYNVVCVYSFGAPRTGNLDWQNAYESAEIPTFRFVNGRDIVPNVPKVFFYHVGIAIYMDDGKILEFQKEWYFSLFLWQASCDRVSDHFKLNYLDSIQKLIM